MLHFKRGAREQLSPLSEPQHRQQDVLQKIHRKRLVNIAWKPGDDTYESHTSAHNMHISYLYSGLWFLTDCALYWMQKSSND